MAVKPVEATKNSLVEAIKVVVLFGLLIAVIAWARAAPETFQTVVTEVGDTTARIVIWVCGLIQDALPAPSEA